MRRTPRAWVAVALGCAALVGTIGCAKDEAVKPAGSTVAPGSTAAGPTTTEATTAGTPTTLGSSASTLAPGDELPVGSLPKAELIVQVDAICKATRTQMASLKPPRTETDLAAYLEGGVAIAVAQLAAIEALGAPTDDADAYRQMFAKQQRATLLLEQKLPAFTRDPATVANDAELNGATKAADEAAQAYGFQECGKSERSGSVEVDGTTPPG